MTGRIARRRGRALLVLVLASIVVNAAIGIYVLLSSHVGRVGGHVLETSASVTLAGLFILACLPAWERRRPRFVPQVGAVATLVTFARLMIGVWGDVDSEGNAKSVGTAFTISTACVIVSVLSLARLAPRFRWIFPAAEAIAAVLATLIVVAIWGPDHPRLIGVAAVLLAAVTFATPVLHIASRGEGAASTEEDSGVRFCPACGQELAAGVTETCATCGRRFRVRFLS